MDTVFFGTPDPVYSLLIVVEPNCFITTLVPNLIFLNSSPDFLNFFRVLPIASPIFFRVWDHVFLEFGFS